MIRVIIADDHHLVRQGIRALLERAADIQVIGEAADGLEAVQLVQELRPEVLVMDLAMPRMNGAQATGRINGLGLPTRVVILSMHSDETLVRGALRSGARGYVLKQAVAEELLLAVRAAVRGEVYLSPAISQTMVQEWLASPSAREQTTFDQLTAREREVLQLIAEGYTNQSIAQTLQISVKTVEKHRASLMAKLDVHDVAGLTRVAIKHGLVFLEQ